jgi:carboxyl-terminal processing protease
MIFRSSLLVVGLFGAYFLTDAIKGKDPINNNDKEALILQSMMQTIEYVHFDPKKVDDDMSKAVFKTFLDRVDGGKRFLTQAEYNKLKIHELKIDNQVSARTFEFFNDALTIVDGSVSRAKINFNEIIEDKLNFTKNDNYETDPEKRVNAKDENDLKNVWRQMVTFEVMTEWTEKIEAQSGADYKGEKKSEDQLKADAIKEIKKRYNDWFDRLTKLRRSDRLETYLGSIANYFDPHTDYFSPKEKADFDINMGGKLEGIGARLQTEGDYTKVSSIVVGGPAWKTKKLSDNDIILKVAQKGQAPVDIAGMRVDDVVQKVRGKKGTVVILTVKKKDGSIIDVEIERDEVQLDDSKAKSALINIPNNVQNIGYIYLPKFYSEFEDGGNSCARDVATEIKKLKDQNVNGIILDLRNNSGGSGLFIEEGPIVQVKGRENTPFLHVDKDPSVLYNGPLVIMVNHFSASASEIIAAAMQDYGRAIIVGSKSTFGKGTVQRFYDLDRSVRNYDEFKPLGSVKMTTQKFYRVNGGSTQLKGVVPDIILPDTYQYIETGEKEYDNALLWTEIAPVKYSQNVVLLSNLSNVVKSSNDRVAANSNFKMLLESAAIIKANRDLSKYPLKLNDYRAMMDRRTAESKKFEDLLKNEIVGLEVSNLKVDLDKINVDESNKAKNDEFIKDLKKDIYLEETMFILRDMIMAETSFVSQQKKIKAPN